MNFTSTRFGEMDVKEEKIINFENGILAFEDCKKFILLNSQRESFYWLQSLDEPDLALPCMDPNVIADNYTPKVSEESLDSIGIKTDDDATILCVVRIPDNFKDATVNLIAPVIINHNTMQGMQIVLEDSRYTVRHRLFE